MSCCLPAVCLCARRLAERRAGMARCLTMAAALRFVASVAELVASAFAVSQPGQQPAVSVGAAWEPIKHSRSHSAPQRNFEYAQSATSAGGLSDQLTPAEAMPGATGAPPQAVPPRLSQRDGRQRAPPMRVMPAPQLELALTVSHHDGRVMQADASWTQGAEVAPHQATCH